MIPQPTTTTNITCVCVFLMNCHCGAYSSLHNSIVSPRGNLDEIYGAIWCYLGLSGAFWGFLGAIWLSGTRWGYLGLSCGFLGAVGGYLGLPGGTWGHLGLSGIIWGQLGLSWGLSGAIWAIWSHLGYLWSSGAFRLPRFCVGVSRADLSCRPWLLHAMSQNNTRHCFNPIQDIASTQHKAIAPTPTTTQDHNPSPNHTAFWCRCFRI